MITTNRLLIRRVRADDWKAIQSIWEDASYSIYAQYDKPNDLDDKSVIRRIAKWASFATSDEHIFLAICLQEIVIGYVVLNMRKNSYELGYCFHSNYHGKGYARESIFAILEVMKKRGVVNITAGTALNNIPSLRLLTYLGFSQTGIEKVSFYKDDEGNDITFDGGNYELFLCELTKFK